MFNLNPKKLTFQTIQTRHISDLIKTCDIKKAAGIDDLSRRFLKDGAEIVRLKPLYKKAVKQILKILGQSPFIR